MSLVFKTPKTAINLTTKSGQNLAEQQGCVLIEGEVAYNENGDYTLVPESGDGFSSVAISVEVPSDVDNQSKTVTITENGESTVTYDQDYTGLSSVGITVNVQPDLQSKNATPTTSEQTIVPDQDKDGLSSVVIAGVTASIDQNIVAGNIKKDVEILGVTGEYDPQPDLEAKTVTYVSNDTYSITPTAGKDGISSVSVTVNVPSDIHNQEKSATPTTSSQEITADNGYSGLSKVTVGAVTSSIDANIASGNIKKDITILGVTGDYDPQPDLQAKTVNSSTSQQVVTPDQDKDGLSSVTVEPYVLQAKSANPTTSQQVIEPDNDKDGLSSVTVAAVTSAIDANIQAGNIKSGVTILGVQGTVNEGITPTGNINITDTQSTDVTNYATAQVVDANLAAGNIKNGVTILGVSGSYDPQPNLDTLNVTPTTSAQTITPTSPVDGFDEVVVSAVTSSIDANIVAGNIKNGVQILGVTGDYAPTLQAKTNIAPTTSSQTISADQNYDGLSSVQINAVDSTIDANIAAGNIKDGVTILGVTGTYSGSGSPCVDWASMGWSCQDVTDSGIAGNVAYTASVKDNNSWTGDTNLVFAPKTSNAEGGSQFQNCTDLVFVPDFTLTGTTASMRNMFYNCSTLKGVGNISTPNSTNNRDANTMFMNCSKLTTVGTIDMNHCSGASSMFSGCFKLTTVNLSNTSSITSFSNMFSSCNSLTSITIPDLSSVTDTSNMFQNAYPSQTLINQISSWDTSGITNFSGMFNDTSNAYHSKSSFTTAPSFDMSSAQNVSSMFGCATNANAKLTTIPQYNWANVTNINNLFGSYGAYSLGTVGGFVNLGKAFLSTDSSSNHLLNLKPNSGSTDLGNTSLMNIINNLAAPDDTACTDSTIRLHSDDYRLLSADDIAVATAKNWSIVSA